MLTLLATLRGHEEDTRVWHAAWSHNGKVLATCGEDKTIRLWSSGGGVDWNAECTAPSGAAAECIATLEEAQSRTVRSCEWSPNDRMLASASFDGTVVVWEAQSAGLKVWDQVATLEGHDNEVKSVAWAPSGQWLATCGRDKRVWVWEVLRGGEFECVAMLEGHTQDVKFVQWHPTASAATLLSASYDDTIKVWKEDNDDWYCADTLTGHASTVWGVAFDDKGGRFVSVSDDKSLFEWQCDDVGGKGTWRVAARIRDLHDLAIYTVDWSRTNGFIATGSGDNSIALCCPSSGGGGGGDSTLHKLMTVAEAHDNDVNCVRWNPADEYGYMLSSTGDDGLVKLWRLSIM